MQEQLSHLIKLQKIEDKKARLIRDRDETPKRIAELEKDYERFETDYLVKKAEYDQARSMHRSLEQGVADLETKIVRSKGRMNEVKTNKEYQAMLKEIEDLKREIGRKEDQMLELMERIDSLGTVLKDLKKGLEDRKVSLDKDKEKLRVQSEQVNDRIVRLNAVEEEVRKNIEPGLLKRCESLFKNRNGIAVAPVQAGVCQVCHLNLPPQKYIELQRDESILQCPHCHRFIYWPGHEGYNGMGGDIEEI